VHRNWHLPSGFRLWSLGLTVVAFGTSAPELAVSVQAALAGEAGVGLGNVFGSNIANVLMILGLSAMLMPLAVSKQLIRVDVPIMILVTAATIFFSYDGLLSRWEGVSLVGGLVVYIGFAIAAGQSKKR
jgi:cation:H+ antiporter